MSRRLLWTVALAIAIVLPLGAADWTTHNGDNQRSGWQKDETALTRDSLGKLQLLWKLKLDNQSRSVYSIIGSPLVIQRLISDRGFKEVVYVAGSSDNLYAIDADLGKLFWKRHFDYTAEVPQAQNASFLCPGGLTAGPVLTPAPARGRGPAPVVAAVAGAGGAAPAGGGGANAAQPAPAAAVPAAPAPVAPGEAARGAAPAGGGGGAFAVRAMYLASSDGMLHQINVTNGEDVAPAMKFMPPNGKPYSLALANNVLYTITGQGCGGNPNSAYAIDLADPAKTVRFWRSGSGGLWGAAGPAIGEDGTIFAETGDGTYDVATNRYANSIVALTPKELKLKDWYTPTNWEWILKRDLDMNVTPVVFNYKGRQLLVGSGKEGRLFLLDAASMGGPNHQTPLFRTELISNEEVDFAGFGTWGNLASWEDADGIRWVLAPVGGPPHSKFKFPLTNGDAPHGSIVAFKVEDVGGKTVLTPAWISRDMMTPAPPVVVNGMVFAIATGEFVRQANERQGGLFQADARAAQSKNAILYALDAKTGKELWSSGNQITSFGHNVGIAIANGRIYFGTYDNTLYAFGFPMEH